jgi:hypothetical protein
MTERMIKLALQFIAALALLIASQMLLVRYGEPQATWLYCDMLGLCVRAASEVKG